MAGYIKEVMHRIPSKLCVFAKDINKPAMLSVTDILRLTDCACLVLPPSHLDSTTFDLKADSFLSVIHNDVRE